MMNSTASPISACLMPMRKALTGARYRGSSCALTRNVSLRAFESHLERAKWVADSGYRRLLRQGWPSAR